MTEERFDACILLIKKGKQEGLKEIYEAYLPYIFSIVKKTVGNKDDAEDITADFFIKLWETAAKYRPGGGHRAYLATIARNMAIDFLRKAGKEVATDMSAEAYPQEADTEGAVQAAARKGVLAREKETPGFEDKVVENLFLAEALKKLSPAELEVVNLKIMGELTFKEISKVLKIPAGTAAWRYRSAIEKIERYGYE